MLNEVHLSRTIFLRYENLSDVENPIPRYRFSSANISAGDSWKAICKELFVPIIRPLSV